MSDQKIEDDRFLEKMKSINANIVIHDFKHKSVVFEEDRDSRLSFYNAFYKFDCFEFMTQLDGISILIDTDVMCINEFDFDKMYNHVNSSNSVIFMLDKSSMLNDNNKNYINGEFFMGNKYHYNDLIKKINEVFFDAINLSHSEVLNKYYIFPKNSILQTEEYFLTYIAQKYNMYNSGNEYIMRVWGFNNNSIEYDNKIKNLTFIHMPQAKPIMHDIYMYNMI